MTSRDPIVFLVDVDNTLIDNDRIAADLKRHLFPRQGHYAHDPKAFATYPPADVSVERIGDLLAYDLPALVGAASPAMIPRPTRR